VRRFIAAFRRACHSCLARRESGNESPHSKAQGDDPFHDRRSAIPHVKKVAEGIFTLEYLAMRKTLAVLSLVALGLLGCEETSSPPTARRLTSPPGNVTPQDGQGNAAASSNASPTSTEPSASSAEAAKQISDAMPAGGDLRHQAFRAANEQAVARTLELLLTLDGVTDEASAQAAAPRLGRLAQAWKQAAETATAAFLTLSDEEQDELMMEAMAAQAPKIDALSIQHDGDLAAQIQRIAKSPGGPAIQRELIAVRDAYLTTRGPYSPLLMRQRLAEKLGPVGSPIKTE
jgi:hypothetical protein